MNDKRDMKAVDLRTSYLNDEQRQKWIISNVFFNTLYFDNEVKVKGKPDVEYCQEALKCYKRIDYYKEWKEWNDKGQYGLINPNGRRIRADLMTGWWNPTKWFLRINGNRKTLSSKLYRTCCESNVQKMNYKEVTEWLSKEFSRSIAACRALCDFLEVVYTEGNIIPIGMSYSPGSTLDGWDTKMLEIFNDSGKHADLHEYIKTNFSSKEEFLGVNKLEDYYSDNRVILFWDRTIRFGFGKASDDEWKTYFLNAKAMINKRNEKLRIECK